MYRIVFDSAIVKWCVCLLFAFLLLQPIAPAFADETSTPETAVEEEVEPVVEEEQEEPQVEVPVVAPEDPVAVSAPDQEVIAEPELEEIPKESDTEEDVMLEEGTATSTEEIHELPPDTPDETEVIPSDTQDGEEETSEVVPDESEEEQSNDDGEPSGEEELTDDVSTSTEESVLIVDHNANQLQFDPTQCASVGNGAFYCSTAHPAEAFEEDGVFAAPDSDGDKEIFVRLNGEETQLTSNLVDDNAPFYDALSDRIVWHTNHNDRYQIMSYDMRTNEETRLTNTRYNNMEPVAYGDITIYQAWIDNNWEIMYHDGTELRRLTTNTYHDVSPSIRDGYIVWQSQFADGWQVAVYDQKTDHVEYVRSEGGAKVENPRFVLVYDSTNKEGDIQTLGYDFDNKQAFTLNSIPASLPDELPEPDQTGETRALIQNKHTIRGTEIQEDDLVPTGTATSTPTSTPESEIPTIDLTDSHPPSLGATSTDTVIKELVIPSFTESTTTPELSHIPDVLIPPLEATSSAEVR